MRGPLLFGLLVLAIIVIPAGRCIRRSRKRKTQLFFTAFIHHYKIQILAMKLAKQKFMATSLALKDSDSGEPIQATFSNVEMSSSDEGVFTVNSDEDGDGNMDVTGVTAGTGTLTVKADCTYTDKNTNEETTVNKTATITVTISANPDPQNTELVVTLSAPQDVPGTN